MDWRRVCQCQSRILPEGQSAIPPIFMALALGVAPPSLSAAPLASPAEPVTGEERKNSGDCDCVESACSLEPLGVARSPRDEACDASVWSWSSAPIGAGLEGIAEFRVARLGVAEADERCVRRFVGEDISALLCSRSSVYRVWAAKNW